jgi:hypothetical protein
MNRPALVATVVIAAMLSAGVFDRSFDPAAAGPIAVSSDAAAETVAAPSADNQPATGPHGRAYLFRGALGPFFSRGMDRLTERLEHAGISANVYEFTICRLIAEQAIRDYRDDPAPIALIGHSMGGLCALRFAEMLQAESIPVNLVVTVDPAHASPSVPLNVERFINIFLSDNVWAAATCGRCKVIKATTQASISRSTTKSRTSISTRWTPFTNNWLP